MNPWPADCIAGLTLAYDGTRQDHLDHVLPILNELGMKGSFFAYPPNLIVNMADWRAAASAGHELGNAFLYGAVDSDGLAPHWPEGTLDAEFQEAHELLESIAKVRSFAFPSVRTSWSESGMPVVEEVISETILKFNEELLRGFAERYRFARSPRDGFNLPDSIPPRQVRSFSADGLDSESLCVLTHLGISQGAWTVLVFSGLSDSPFDLGAHEKFVRWLLERREVLYIAPFEEISRLLTVPADVKL